MMNILRKKSLTPPILRPPDDPTWWLLNGRVGWLPASISMDGKIPIVETSSIDKALRLAPIPGTGRLLTEDSGSFGGLDLPTNVALGPAGTIYLLDNVAMELKWFDPCKGQFISVHCLGGRARGLKQIRDARCEIEREKSKDIGEAPRQFSDPHGIGIRGGNLFVCDTGNNRLSVFSLHGFRLRAIWSPPPSSGLANDWEPYAVTFDSQCRVFVTDGANSCIHRFSPAGCWQLCFPGFGKVTHIAIDCRNQLYVVTEGVDDSVRVLDTNGKALGTVSRPDELVPHFSRLPFPVDAKGNLHLTGRCSDSRQNGGKRPQLSESDGIFDLHGNPIKIKVDQDGPIYYEEGCYMSEALDSKLYQCQWHRVILRGQVPTGARLHVSTYTAETRQPIDHVLDLPENAWKTDQTVYQMDGGEWDCLVRSDGGRFLWLRLKLTGNGLVTPTIESIKVEFPRISLRRYLPAVFGEDPSGSDFTDRFLSIFDTTLRSIEGKIDYQARYLDPLSAPTDPDPKTGLDFLSWLASWIGVTLNKHWTDAKRRQFLKRAARLFHIRGTREGLWKQLLFYLGMESEDRYCPNDQPKKQSQNKVANSALCLTHSCAWHPPPLILEHFQLRRWLFVGAGRLGDQAELWGKRIVNRSQLEHSAQLDQTQLVTTQDPYRDPFHVYAHKFSVFVPASYKRSDRHRKGLETLINSEKPVHTLFCIEYVEPRFRIGIQSMIGFDSVIGKYPQGINLHISHLGRASVLSSSPHRRGGPSFEIGKEARIGSTTRLD
jgi:phage tail-like protein